MAAKNKSSLAKNIQFTTTPDFLIVVKLAELKENSIKKL